MQNGGISQSKLISNPFEIPMLVFSFLPVHILSEDPIHFNQFRFSDKSSDFSVFLHSSSLWNLHNLSIAIDGSAGISSIGGNLIFLLIRCLAYTLINFIIRWLIPNNGG